MVELFGSMNRMFTLSSVYNMISICDILIVGNYHNGNSKIKRKNELQLNGICQTTSY